MFQKIKSNDKKYVKGKKSEYNTVCGKQEAIIIIILRE